MNRRTGRAKSSLFIVPCGTLKNPHTIQEECGMKSTAGVVALLFSPAVVAGLAVMSLKRLVVYEAT